LGIFVIYLTNIFVTYRRNLFGSWTDLPQIGYQNRAWLYAYNYQRGYLSESAIWIFMIIILWIRVFYLLKYNELIGKFVAILYQIILEIFLFFIGYLLQLVFFSVLAQLCF